MAYSSKPDSYPPEFQQLFDKAIAEGGYEIELESYQQATSLRHQLHAYRRAVEAHQTPGWSKLRSIQFAIDKNKLIVRNQQNLLDSIKKSLALPQVDKDNPTEEDIEAYLKRLDGEHDG